MGVECWVKMMGGAIFTSRWCLRSVCDHPFVVGILCFLVFLYRSSPFAFSLLLSTSPVLVCTALLLGTILSFGQMNLPEIDVEVVDDEEVLMEMDVFRNDNEVVAKKLSCYVEGRDGTVPVHEQTRLAADELGDCHGEDCLDETIMERSCETAGNCEFGEENGYLGVMGSSPAAESDEDRLSDDEHIEIDDLNADSNDSESVDSLNSHSPPPWKHVEVDDALDSGSDVAESSSPDASMTDIMPILDELHPLLDDEAHQPVHARDNGSNSACERSSSASSSSHETDDESENRGDGEDEEDMLKDKEGLEKFVVSWTEEDQKNVMDLGNSEIERNRWLERLILMRRARKNTSELPERKLIDFESFDIPFSIPPVSTKKQNPFDHHHDSYDDSGLPPIPGSAPSVSVTRQDLFDIPHDSSGEKVSLMENGFQNENTVQSRVPLFRKHASFKVGASSFAPAGKERAGINWMPYSPYFVPEQMVSEESRYSAFQRESSEMSDSKASSVCETESTCSVEDGELLKQSNPNELEQALWIEDSFEEGSSGKTELFPKFGKANQECSPQEQDLISEMVQSWKEEDSLEKGQFENRDAEFNMFEFHLDNGEVCPDDKSVTQLPNGQTTRSQSNSDVELRFRRCSSISPMPEQPVYNSIPDDAAAAAVRNKTSSSTSFDAGTALGSTPVLVKRKVSFIERETAGSSHEITDIPRNIETLLKLHPVGQHESQQMDKSMEDHSIGNEEIVLSPNFDPDIYCGPYHELIPEPSIEEHASIFCDKVANFPTVESLNTFQTASTSGKSFEGWKTTQILNIQEFQELDYDIFPNGNSPLSPDFISIPSSASEVASPAVMHVIVEEDHEIKNIDEELLLELDGFGNFSIEQLKYGSNEFKKHVDSVDESVSSAHHAVNDPTRVDEVNLVEMNNIEYAMNFKNSIQRIDLCEDGTECGSVLQTLKSGIDKECNGNSVHQEVSEEETTLLIENEVKPVVKFELDVQSAKAFDFLPKKAELACVETQVMVENHEAPMKLELI